MTKPGLDYPIFKLRERLAWERECLASMEKRVASGQPLIHRGPVGMTIEYTHEGHTAARVERTKQIIAECERAIAVLESAPND